MAIAYVNAGTHTYTSGTAGCTPPLPSSVVAGNLLLAAVFTQGSGGAHVWPAGWTQIDQQSWNSGTFVSSIAYRVATGADSAPAVTWPSVTFSSSKVTQYSGTSSAPISAARSVATGTTASHTSASVTTTADNSMVVLLDFSRQTGITNPATWTQDANSIDSGSLCAFYFGEKTIPTAGSGSGAVSVAGGTVGWVQWQQELLFDADSSGSSSLDLPAIEFTNTAITDTLGSSDSTLVAIAALSEGYSGNASSVSLASILASGTALQGGVGTSTATLASILASGAAEEQAILEALSTMAMGSSAEAAWALFATSTGSFTSTGASPTIFWEVVTSSTTVDGTIAGQRSVDATVTGSVVFDGVVLGQASYSVSASSLAQILSGIQFVQDYWDGWAFNLNTGAASTYENFKFNSFARIGTNYYGCNDAGIYLLSGDSDAGTAIDATMTLATTDLSTDKISGKTVKNVPTVYITARSPEKMVLTARVEGAENAYDVHAAKDPMAATRVDLGKGARGTLWQLEVANRDGADMEIESMQVDVVATTRRR